jgi:Tetratricopeptide repeat
MWAPSKPQMPTPLDAEVKQFYQTGKYRKAEPLYERALAIREKTLGPDHLDVRISLNNLAALYEAQDR